MRIEGRLSPLRTSWTNCLVKLADDSSMFKKTLFAFCVLLLLILTYGLNQLRSAHSDIDSVSPELPGPEAVLASGQLSGLPTSIAYYNTASQRVARKTMLDEDQDPGETANKRVDAESAETGLVEMSFPAFVVTWEDGRQFVIDAGFSRAEAIDFGRRSALAGAGPIEFHGLLADQLDMAKVKGIGFTHLHGDHMMGSLAFCRDNAEFTLVQTMEQHSWHSYLTKGSAKLLNELDCGMQLLLDDTFVLKGIKDFPGLYVVYAGGHTLGSQIFVAHINEGARTETYILAGDMANHFDGVRYNVSKPPAYSRWIVPENLDQLYKVRSWLKLMNQETDISVFISHDKRHLNESGMTAL